MKRYLLLPLFMTALGPSAYAQRPVMSNGHPAIACTCTFRGDVTWGIEQVDLDGQPAFAVAVYQRNGLRPSGNLGTLVISAGKIAFHSPKQQEDFDEGKPTVQWKTAKESPWTLSVKTSHHSYKFWASAPIAVSNGWFVDGFPTCRSLLDSAYTNFPAAWTQFYGLTAVLPVVRDVQFRAFQPQAAAWRALPTKPPLSPEADKEWILAENAIKERNLPAAFSHYIAALQAQQLLWPTGWYNLALAVAQQNDFVGAADCMRYYLELVPDSPDAKAAREQLIIWQDKAQSQQPPQMNLVPVLQTQK
jgi:hypothetical protein